MVGLDNSKAARKAFDFAKQLLRPKDHLYCVICKPPIDPMSWDLGKEVHDAMEASNDKACQELLDEYKDLCLDVVGNVSFQVGASTNNRRKEMLRLIAANDVDTVFLGSTGSGSALESVASRFLMGSFAEYITRHAPCNVMIVRK